MNRAESTMHPVRPLCAHSASINPTPARLHFAALAKLETGKRQEKIAQIPAAWSDNCPRNELRNLLECFAPSVLQHHPPPTTQLRWPLQSGRPYLHLTFSGSHRTPQVRRQREPGTGQLTVVAWGVFTDWALAPLLAQFLAFPGHVLTSILRTCNCTSTPSKRLFLPLPLPPQHHTAFTKAPLHVTAHRTYRPIHSPTEHNSNT
ncbi:hypothetical protein B0T19DRAFT_281652 [Cercophora scortea]|uniref:Uncharacterized protein n=1 Tax=Cercophora scortea TaxID=314031 RepID=A0AAE0M696_9PEZI|nr:hypothetical protein B0T19DRAFT_281652 [Cercophora scortea]